MLPRLTYALLLLVCLWLAAFKTLAEEPWYVDDEKLADKFSIKLIELVKQGKCLSPEELHKKLAGGKCKVAWKTPGRQPLTPEDVYRRALSSVFVLGSVEQTAEHPGGWQDGRLATAWALTEDGVLVTNWHVFDKVGKECYGVVNSKGEVFPLIDFLGSNRAADIALIRVAGKGFIPLPLAADEAVGAWVCTLGHPGNQFFTFTQGHVTRYTKNMIDGKDETMDVRHRRFRLRLQRRPGVEPLRPVVGMAALTSNIDYPLEQLPENKPADEKPPAEKPAGEKERKPPEKAPQKSPGKIPAKVPEKAAEKPPEKPPETALEPEGSLVQMVVKLAVPGRTIQEFCTSEKAATEPAKAPAK